MSQPFPPSFELSQFLHKQVIVDTDSSYVYIGYLEGVGNDYLSLSKVDVHDVTDSDSTKEHYAHESRKVGERYNRQLTLVRLARVVSISKMDDVLQF